MDEKIDYQAVASAFQRENEQLRLIILKLRNSAPAWGGVSLTEIRQALRENYLEISASALILFVSLSLVSLVRKFLPGKVKE